MIRPIARHTAQNFIQEKNNSENKVEGENAITEIQSSLANSLEELAMARSIFQKKERKTNTREADDLGRLLETDAEVQEALTKISDTENITRETITQALVQIKNDISKYQLLRYLLTNTEITAAVYQFIFEELEKLKRKRKKLISLENIEADTLEMSKRESISALQLQEIFIAFLEYQGHITPYYDDVYKKSKKKYKNIVKFISRMLNYEIFALTINDDLDAFIYMTEKRRELNMLNDVYEKLEALKEFDDLDFVYLLLNNIDVEAFCDKLTPEKASRLVTFFARIPQELFYSPEDKEEMLATMKKNITNRFKRQWN